MKNIHKRIPVFLLLLALLVGIFPMQTSLAADAWTAYGRAGHATANGDSVSFHGHPMDPFVTLLFRPANDGDYRTLTFHLTEGNSDWHTIEGSGFIYNAGIVNNAISGDAILFSASSVSLYKLTNVSLSWLQGANFTACPGVSLVESKAKPTYSSGSTWYLKLVMSPGSLKVEKHASPAFAGAVETIFNKTFAPSARSPYSGYGPFASFVAHDCPSISTSSFDYFNLTIKPNTPPTVTAPDAVLKRGETYNAMTGVAAADAEDGNLTSSATMTRNTVDTNIPGVYQSEYSVADILGATGTCSRTVTVLADAYFHVMDVDTEEPITGVGITTSAGDLPDTDENGETPVMWVTPGAYAWEVSKQHDEYLPLTGRFDVQIDSAANDEWPMRIPVTLIHKYRDAAVSLALDTIGEEKGKDTARYNQEVSFDLTIASNSNEVVCVKAEITAPDTLELLCEPVISTETLTPGESVIYPIPCRVTSLMDTATAILKAEVKEITLPDTGEAVPDENPENDMDTADLKIKNIPIIITKTDVRTKAALSGVVFQVLRGDTAIPFIKMENGAWIKADVAPKGGEDTAKEKLPTEKDGKLTIYGMGQGEYALREMEALPGYVLPAEKWPFKVNADAEPIGNFALTNEPTVLVVTKVDATTEAPLDGAAFRMLDMDGKPILLKQQESGEYHPDEKGVETFTAKDGKATLCYLPLGKLTIEETTPPKGYAAAAPIPIELKSEHVKAKPLAVTVADKPLAVVIKKMTKANTPLTGAGFAITTGSAATIMTFTKDKDGIFRYDNMGKETTLLVNERGEIRIYGLPAAEYTITETVVPDGYIAAVPQKFTLTDACTSDKPYEVIVINEPFVKLGFDTDGWILPVSVILLALSAIAGGTFFYKKKTGAWWFMRKGKANDEA